MDYFNNNNVSLLQKIKHHLGDVTTVDFGPNSLLCSGSGDKTVVVWEWKSGFGYEPTCYSPLIKHKYAVTCVRFAPHGRLFLASSSVDGTTLLWDVKSGACLQSLVQSGGNGVRMCCFSYDATLFATAGEGGTLCLWDLTNFSLIRTIDGHDEESVQGISFSPDAMLFITGDVTGTYRVWHVNSAKDMERDPFLITVRDAHDLGINALEFSSQHTIYTNDEGISERTYLFVTCGNDHVVNLWQLSITHPAKSSETPVIMSHPTLLTVFRGHNSAISSVRFSPKGDYLASTSIDKTTRMWLVSSGKCLKTLEGHSRYVACCAFSRNQIFLATGSNDKSIMVWDLSGEFDINCQLVRSSSASTLAYMRNGGLEGVLNDNSSSVNLYQKLEKHSGGVNSCDFSTEFLASAGSDRSIVLWEWTEEGLNYSTILEGHRYSVNQVEFSKDGSLASCSLDGTTLIWDPRSGDIINSGFHVSGNGVRCVRFSSDCSLLAVGGDDDLVHIFSAQNCQHILSLENHLEAVTSLSFSEDSRYLVTGSSDSHTRVFSMSPPTELPLLIIENCHDLGVSSVDFSPLVHTMPLGVADKYEVATCGQDCLVIVWKVDIEEKTASTIWKLSGHGGSVTCVRYSPGLAELIASTATDKTCRLWDSYSGDCLHVLDNHQGIVTCCAFSPSGSYLATGSMDKTVLVWELPKDLAFQSFVASRLKPVSNPVNGWSVSEVNNWLKELGVAPSNISGNQLLKSSLPHIMQQLKIEDDLLRIEVEGKIMALRQADSRLDIPHDLICPITHQLMREPVKLQDGYTYEKTAIEAWLKSGHVTSPMTNTVLSNFDLQPNQAIQANVHRFLNCIAQN